MTADEIVKQLKPVKKDYQLALDLYNTVTTSVPGRADRRRFPDDQEGPAPLAQAGDLHRAL